jgi:NIMA (never in mitosis gene a)-related kinase
MSPEQVKESRYNRQSDIWSLGCLIYELAALQPPFRASNHLALAKKIEEGTFAPLPAHYTQVS